MSPVSISDIEKAAQIASILLPEVINLVTTIVDLIRGSDLPEATKEELLERIKVAQASVPEWK